MHTQSFPFGTLAVNIIACFIMGSIIGLADHKEMLSNDARLFWAVGFCGGFSTFSAFTHESITLIQNGLNIQTLIYIILSVFFCIVATFSGLFIVRFI